MLENNLQPRESLETEISLLNEQIEQKRAQLERENKVVSDKELIKDVLVDQQVKVVSSNQLDDDTDDGNSYLNNLGSEVAEVVNGLVDQVFKQGLNKTLKSTKKLSALELDAFHDTLTDRFYDELSARGFIK